MELESFKKGQGKFSCFGLLKILKNYKKGNANIKTKIKETQNKQLERKRTQIHEIGKT
jgi:hypothetical protein